MNNLGECIYFSGVHMDDVFQLEHISEPLTGGFFPSKLK